MLPQTASSSLADTSPSWIQILAAVPCTSTQTLRESLDLGPISQNQCCNICTIHPHSHGNKECIKGSGHPVTRSQSDFAYKGSQVRVQASQFQSHCLHLNSRLKQLDLTSTPLWIPPQMNFDPCINSGENCRSLSFELHSPRTFFLQIDLEDFASSILQ